MILSVVIPCFNEEETLAEIVGRVLAADTLGLDREIVIVDDKSTDGSLAIARDLAERHTEVRVLEHAVNRGKSAALRTAFAVLRGDLVVVQDADLEYSPADYAKLLAPLVEDRADVVYGSRFLEPEKTAFLHLWHRLANRVLTLASNLFTGLRLTDMCTCYKMFRKNLLDSVEIREERFGFCPEFTAKVSRLKPPPRFHEVAIGYTCRSYENGKKITWRDAARAIYCIVRYNVLG